MPRMRVGSIEISNYLGAGSDPVRLDLDGHHAVLSGPNNSGKTTLVSALPRLYQLLQVSVLQSYGGPTEGEPFSWPVIMQEWRDIKPHATAQLFHGRARSFRTSARLLVDANIEAAKDALPLIHESGDSSFAFYICVREDQTMRFEKIELDGLDVFVSGESTGFFKLATTDSDRIAGFSRYQARYMNGYKVFGLPGSLLQKVIYFPSHRRPSIGPDNFLGSLAAGVGLVNWIESATSADPRDLAQVRRHHLLQEFQREFADFAGFQEMALSVPKYSLPLPNNEQPEINLTVNGRLQMLSQLGAGIGESLILLFVAKLSQEWNPQIDVIVLEEPELHLHPRLQRKLLDRLFASGVQLITTTHSPTVIDAMVKQGAAVFRTEFDQPRNVIKIDSVKGVGESRALLDSIGASPADLLLADRVLFVEGPTEMPVFKAWLEKLPAARGQNITILSLGGSDVASDSFDPRELEKLHPKIFAILDSEIGAAGAPADAEKLKIKEKLEAVGVHCDLTERRATENYFTTAALRTVCHGLEALGPYDDPGLLAQRGQQFSKRKNGLVADAMRWEDLERTDLGEALQAFLKL